MKAKHQCKRAKRKYQKCGKKHVRWPKIWYFAIIIFRNRPYRHRKSGEGKAYHVGAALRRLAIYRKRLYARYQNVKNTIIVAKTYSRGGIISWHFFFARNNNQYLEKHQYRESNHHYISVYNILNSPVIAYHSAKYSLKLYRNNIKNNNKLYQKAE